MSQLVLDLPSRRRLTADWFGRLADEAGLGLKQQGTSGASFTFGTPDTLQVTAAPIDEEPFLAFTSSDPNLAEQIEELAEQAAAEAASPNFGGEVWYSTSMVEAPWSMAAPQFMGSLILRLGTQTRITGWRRLGRSILLEFTEEQPEGDAEGKPQLLAPKAEVRIHVAVPGPQAGHFSSHVAHSVIETVGAICTFALGRPVTLPPTAFPTKEAEIEELEEKRADQSIMTLARKHVPLDIFGWLGRPGGFQVFERLRSALLTADAAVKQEHDSVAAILYVVAAECLTVPPAEWRKKRLTKRFREFYDEMIPEALDEIVNHANFEEAIGLKRGNRTARALRRDALDRIYSFRSGLLHEGLDPVYRGFISDVGSQMKRALFADFVEAALLAYIRAPRSSVVGLPALEPDE